MLRDYMLVSPSLDGILNHDSIVYEGVKRPNKVMRAFDRARTAAEAVSLEIGRAHV